MKNIVRNVLFIIATLSISYCKLTDGAGKKNKDITENITSNGNGKGLLFELNFEKGEAYNHPTFVFWLEDTTGNFVQTLFVTKSFGSGTFNYGKKWGGKWLPGQVKRPAALPYWSHKAKFDNMAYVPDSIHPVADAYTGSTPKNSFVLKARSDNNLPQKFKILFEVNQTWDWNEYWHNSKYLDDKEYNTSCQPAVVYATTIDASKKGETVQLLPIGRSSHSGADGNLYTDLNTLTTALNIAEKITVKVSAE